MLVRYGNPASYAGSANTYAPYYLYRREIVSSAGAIRAAGLLPNRAHHILGGWPSTSLRSSILITKKWFCSHQSSIKTYSIMRKSSRSIVDKVGVTIL